MLLWRRGNGREYLPIFSFVQYDILKGFDELDVYNI